MIYNKHTDHLTKILAKTEWSQAQLADALQVSFATVNRWLNGHTLPQAAQIK